MIACQCGVFIVITSEKKNKCYNHSFHWTDYPWNELILFHYKAKQSKKLCVHRNSWWLYDQYSFTLQKLASMYQPFCPQHIWI